MAVFVFYDDVNFQQEFGTVFGLGAGDLSFSQDFDLFGLPVFTENRFNQLDGSQIVGLTQTLFGFTTIERFDAGALTPDYTFTFQTPLQFNDGYDLQAAAASLQGPPVYISEAPGAVIQGFGLREEFIGQGRFMGAGGSDKIELEDYSAAFGTRGGLGSAETSTAMGGGGQDILKAAVQNSVLIGGGGADVLVLEFGTSTMTGGGGADTFIFDNGFWDVVGSTAQAAAASIATITDFAGADDLVFATVDAVAAPPSPVRQSFEDLFGAGTLATLGDQTIDGVLFTFTDTADGAVITRTGTDSDGLTFDTSVTVEAVALAEIDRADVFTQIYDADTYEFF
ncbi:MAG: hypothetical protein AAGA32_07955 [Pseudomonadota bacterium]